MFRLATQRPVAVLMITAALAFFGVLSYRQLGLALMPDLAYPTLTVRADYPGAAPEEVEAEVTRPIEGRLGTVEALVGMNSSSRAGRSEIVLEFAWETDMDRAAQRVRERMARLDLPTDEQPILLRYDPALVPVMTLAVRGGDSLAAARKYAEDELSPELSKIEGVAAVRVLGGDVREVEVRLRSAAISGRGLSVAGVAQRLAEANVNVAGGTLKEGSVEFLVRTLAELKTPEEIGRVVVGEVDGALIRLRDVADVAAVDRERTSIVRVAGAEAVRVDVFRRADANIVAVCDRVRSAVFGTDAQQAYVAAGERAGAADPDPAGGPGKGPEGKRGKQGKKGKRGDKMKAARMASRHRSLTDFIGYRRPAGAEITALSDQSVFIRAALDEVRSAAALGGLLAIFILYLFLRSGYGTLLIAVAIPLSIAVTFVPLMLFDVSLNVMSLGGLALGVGMLVDNSVVVLESIHRCAEEGDDAPTAAVRGVEEVGGAVVASTLTTVAVFFPIVFVEGVAGQVFGDLALAVVFSLLASLVVALFVVPTLSARRWQTGPSQPTVARWSVPIRGLPWWWGLRARGVLGWLAMLALVPYVALRTALEVGANLALFALAAVAIPATYLSRAVRWLVAVVLTPFAAATVGLVESLRGVYGRALAGVLRAPLPVLLAVTALGAGAYLAARSVGAELIPEVRQGILDAAVRYPVGTPLAATQRRVAVIEAEVAKLPQVARVEAFVGEPEAGEDAGEERGPHTAVVTVRLTPDALDDEAEVIDAIRRIISARPGADVSVSRPALFSLRPPLRVVILGHRLDLLEQTAQAARAILETTDQVTDVRSSVRLGYPELQIRYDRQRLASLGLAARDVAEGLRDQVEGEVATELREGDERTEVRVRAAHALTDSVEAIGQLVINPGRDVPLPLEAVADLRSGTGPAEIRHVDGQRAAVLTARTSSFDLRGVAQRIEARLAAVPRPVGFEIRLRGQDEEMKVSLDSLKFALLLAIFLVYVVMASQFESLRAPLVIMGSLPLAAVGVMFALQALAIPLSVVVFVGLITLAGIVVNNAIVLVDYAQRLLDRGLPLDEALVEAGKARLRPILMTTATTVLGLTPLAIDRGAGAELRQPIAITLIAGLVFATGLTLVVIPVLYRWIVGATAERRTTDRTPGA